MFRALGLALSFIFISGCGVGGVLSIRSRTSSSRFWLGDFAMQSDLLDGRAAFGRLDELYGLRQRAVNGLRSRRHRDSNFVHDFSVETMERHSV
jgi:hypothetical protein